MLLLRDRRPDFEDAGVVPVGISRDSPWSHVAWCQALDLHDLTLVSDWNAEAIRGFGVAQDYPIHLFSHLRRDETPLTTARKVWPPLATGVASTCIAYLAFLMSGVTGLAQVHGDYHSSPETKVRYDLAYIANWSLWLDCTILLRTVKVVLTSPSV